MKKIQQNYLSIFLISSIFLIATPCKASANNEIGFLFNDDLQKFLSRSIQVYYDDYSTKLKVGDYTQIKPALAQKPNYISEIENVDHCAEKVANISVCNLTNIISTMNHPKKGAVVSIDETKIKEFVASVSTNIEKEPVNGRFRMTQEGNLEVVEKSKVGYSLNIAKSTEKISEAIRSEKTYSIPLIIVKQEPKFSTKSITNLKIAELVGRGESNFRGSPKNRIYNIGIATEKFDGVIVSPGEEFSFTSILGPVDGESGYKKELVIKENKTIPEFGGGVCQVSTTMFRAALNSGFKITERRNHAYPVQYYSPQGTDATIYLPSPDLKFVNNFPTHILIQSKIEGTKLSFDVYGTSDQREVEIGGPRVTKRTSDGGMGTILYQKVKKPDGSYLLEDVFKSFYQNPAKYHEQELTEKPKDWSNKQWKEYKQQHGI